MKTSKKHFMHHKPNILKMPYLLRLSAAHYTTRLSAVLFAVFAICTFCGCSSKEPLSRTSLFFDTYVTITIYDEDATPALLEQCFERAAYFEQCFSPTLEESDIRKINESAGNPVTVHPETAELIRTALSYCELSDGAIDITIEPISRLWDFSSESLLTDRSAPSSDSESTGSGDRHDVPDKSLIASLLPHVDYHKVNISGNTVTLADPYAQINLGFIAKGYIADDLKAYLESEGIKHALIDLGGNILAIGTKPDGSPFRIGVQKPFDRRGISIITCSIMDMSLVSSGIYERYFEQDGQLYHHILDTSSGYPAENDLYGVTILSGSSTAGDALSTTCFVLGLEKGMALIESMDGVEALFITKDYDICYTSTFPASTS